MKRCKECGAIGKDGVWITRHMKKTKHIWYETIKNKGKEEAKVFSRLAKATEKNIPGILEHIKRLKEKEGKE